MLEMANRTHPMSRYLKENDNFFKFTKHVSTELLSSSVEWFTKHGKLNNK